MLSDWSPRISRYCQQPHSRSDNIGTCTSVGAANNVSVMSLDQTGGLSNSDCAMVTEICLKIYC